MNFREIFERLVKLWAGKFRLSLRILKTHSVTLPEKVRGLEGTWGLLVLEVGRKAVKKKWKIDVSMATVPQTSWRSTHALNT